MTTELNSLYANQQQEQQDVNKRMLEIQEAILAMKLEKYEYEKGLRKEIHAQISDTLNKLSDDEESQSVLLSKLSECCALALSDRHEMNTLSESNL